MTKRQKRMRLNRRDYKFEADMLNMLPTRFLTLQDANAGKNKIKPGYPEYETAPYEEWFIPLDTPPEHQAQATKQAHNSAVGLKARQSGGNTIKTFPARF